MKSSANFATTAPITAATMTKAAVFAVLGPDVFSFGAAALLGCDGARRFGWAAGAGAFAALAGFAGAGAGAAWGRAAAGRGRWAGFAWGAGAVAFCMSWPAGAEAGS